MELNLSKTVKTTLTIFLLIVLPLLILLIGLITEIFNAWFYILCVVWFGMGLIFYSAIE
jgi:hypothetical protein